VKKGWLYVAALTVVAILITAVCIHVTGMRKAQELEHSKFLGSLNGADLAKLQSVFGPLDVHRNPDGTGETEAYAADWHGWRVGFRINKHGLWKIWIGPYGLGKRGLTGSGAPHRLHDFKDWRNQLKLDFGVQLERVRFVRENDNSPIETYLVEFLDPPPGVLRVDCRVSGPQVTDTDGTSTDSILWNPRSSYDLMVFYEWKPLPQATAMCR
jgi:hypothetical protein